MIVIGSSKRNGKPRDGYTVIGGVPGGPPVSPTPKPKKTARQSLDKRLSSPEVQEDLIFTVLGNPGTPAALMVLAAGVIFYDQVDEIMENVTQVVGLMGQTAGVASDSMSWLKRRWHKPLG